MKRLQQDGYMLHINGLYYVRQDKCNNRFYVCDVDGIAEGEDLEHIGDDYSTIEEAIKNCHY